MGIEALAPEAAVVENKGDEVALDSGRALQVGFDTPQGVFVLARPSAGDCMELILLRPGKQPLSVARARRGTDNLVAQLWIWIVAKNVPPPMATCAGGCGTQAREREDRSVKHLPPKDWAHECCPACAPWRKRLGRWIARTWARVLGKRP